MDVRFFVASLQGLGGAESDKRYVMPLPRFHGSSRHVGGFCFSFGHSHIEDDESLKMPHSGLTFIQLHIA